ncbi:MAG: metallophosphoesterase family protein [Anaerolineae bacterium]|nr:metallophosphoesterase family protein [Anaerolineae bacterium]
MKLAVLADIHANLAALERVVEDVDAWQPDVVVVGGDVVNRGPQPAECLALVLERQRTHGWLTVLGNHEEYVISQAGPDPPGAGADADIYRPTRWTLARLGGDIAPLQAMPFQQNVVSPVSGEVRIVHASTRGTRDGIFPQTRDDTLRLQVGSPPPAVLCVGHTHWPLVRQVDDTLVVNVGSVGLPFDGDTRASYGQLTWENGGWQAEVVRLAYDRQRTEEAYVATGFLEQAGPLARLHLAELRSARSQLYSWVIAYEDEILHHRISVDEAVDRWLADGE